MLVCFPSFFPCVVILYVLRDGSVLCRSLLCLLIPWAGCRVMGLIPIPACWHCRFLVPRLVLLVPSVPVSVGVPFRSLISV